MAESQFLLFGDENKDDSSLGRARSMTKTLEKKGKSAIVPTTSINTEFAQIVNRLKQLQEEWRKRRMTRKVPIITLKYSDMNTFSDQDTKNKIETLMSDKKQLTATVSSLFKEMQHLKQQNQSMAQRIEKLRKVLHESKSYAISLKQRNDNLTSDMDFQSDLHEKQRRVWKTKIRASVTSYDSNGANTTFQFGVLNGSLNGGNNSDSNLRLTSKSITEEILDLDKILKEYESTIEKQREQIKYKNEQLGQQKSVFRYEKNQQYAELTKEINHLKNQRQQEIEELKIKMEQTNTELERAKQENGRLHKTLEVTNNELNANRKLIEASRPLNATQTEQQLFQLEQDYLNLSEVLVACQHRVTKIENELDEKQHELDDANRLIDEQNKTMEEYKKSIQLLQANLAESKSDQSDLINALQQEWEQCKEEVIRYKQKCRQLQHEKDELIAKDIQQSIARNGLQTLHLQTAQPMKSNYNNYNNYNKPLPSNESNPEMVVLMHDLQRKLQQKEDEVKSQEMLMKQLMEQQKAFQKRNKTLVGRLKAIKKNSNNNNKLDEGGGGGFDTYFYNGPIPENVTVEMKSLYDHYVRNPLISTNDMIHKIRIKSQHIVSNQNQNDYIIPDFSSMRINSPNAILIVIEDILIQRQNAINSENKKISQILSLKEQHEQHLSKIELDKKRLYCDIRKLQNQLNKYEQEIHELEERKLFSSSDDNLVAEIEKLQKENERIAQEFLQGANVWNSEKAIMAAERAQIENDISYIAHNLEQLILERQQFEEEADQFQGLYVNLIAHLRDKGMQVEIEYVNEDQNKSQYSQLAIKDDNFVSNRRKRNTMRLKLYQATTQPATLKEECEEYDDYKDNQNQKSIKMTMTHKKRGSDVSRVNTKNKALKSYKKKNERQQQQQQQQQHPQHGHSMEYALNKNNNNDDRKPSIWKRVSINQKKMKVTDVMGGEELAASPSSPRLKNASKSSPSSATTTAITTTTITTATTIINSSRNNSESSLGVIKEQEIKPIAIKQQQQQQQQPINNMNINDVEDEADAYIPFDEPDEFNLLDEEYKKSAMKFVSENDNFMIQSIDSMNGDVNLMAQEVLSQELQRKQEKLPVLQGWIEKKSPTFARGWQKRWVIVREYNIFYGKNKTDIKDTKNEAERKKFLNAIPLLVVQYIVATDHSRSGRKFEIVARDPRTGDRRHYQWKAGSREECDKWVHGLNAHKKLLAARLQFLANTGQTTTQ